jgi:hypothetical protein
LIAIPAKPSPNKSIAAITIAMILVLDRCFRHYVSR